MTDKAKFLSITAFIIGMTFVVYGSLHDTPKIKTEEEAIEESAYTENSNIKLKHKIEDINTKMDSIFIFIGKLEKEREMLKNDYYE